MAQRLYVGSLPYTTTEDSLRQLFSEAGTVSSATVVTDKMTGRSRGFGFVEMSADEEAQKAIEMFNGRDFEGRKLVVNEAQPMNSRPRTGGFGPRRDFRGGGGGGGHRDF